jgi:hypothetical protein
MKVEDKRIRNKRNGTLGLWQINDSKIVSNQSEAAISEKNQHLKFFLFHNFFRHCLFQFCAKKY